ncbi:MAG: uroporphyrinogen-III synthase [Porticoccaceae bacterium]|jgi:uroporphyrinogen-III synthase|nr:uroporphyrinogen-III synthase [Porticoccaceae bacterium]
MVVKHPKEKTVLVVRPLREQDAFLQLLKAADISYCYNPIMRIVPITEPSASVERIRDLMLQFAQFDQAIFISANAAEQAIEWLDQYWPMLPEVQLFAVGQQTAQILKDYGAQVLSPQRQQNTEGLLQEMPQLQHLDNKSVIIFRGAGGRTTLADTLINRGASVTYCDLYRRVIDPDSLAQAQAEVYQCLVAHSGELLQAMGPNRNKATALVVPSDRVAAIGRDLGYERLVVAESALPEPMCRAVQQALA